MIITHFAFHVLYVKRKESAIEITTLHQGHFTVKIDPDKAETQDFFHSGFNHSHPPLMTLSSHFTAHPFNNDSSLNEMYCIVSEATQLLQNFEVSKAIGLIKSQASCFKILL